MKLGATFAVLVVTAVAAAGTAAGAPARAQVTVTPIARVPFPGRGFLVGLPTSRQLTASDVVVRENGEQVKDPSFVPASKSAARRAVMLVIDSSDSMRGQPLRDALGAGRAFVDRLGAQEQLGVIAFDSGVAVVQKPTSDVVKLDAALDRVPTTASGTHIYDALGTALDTLQKAHVAAGSVVLLSDGADTGSTTSKAAVVTRARGMRVRIFTVGLASPQFRPAKLRLLAHATGAQFAEASSARELQPIYADLARRLANEYLLRYRSESDPGAHVVVTVHVDGFAPAVGEYTAPKPSAVSPYSLSPFTRFWESAASVVIISLLVAMLVGGVVLAILRRSRTRVAGRVAEFTTLSPPTTDAEEPKLFVSRALFGGPERSLARTRWWTNFIEELEIANVRYPASQLLGVAILGTILLGLLLYLASPIFCIFALAVPFAVRGACRQALQKVRRAFEDQFPDNLQVLASALRAGHSFVGALSVVAAEASEPSKREFLRVVADEQLGVPLEDSLREVARRMDNEDLEQVAIVAELQRQSGGNMAEVLDRVVENVRSRFELKRLVRTLTAQGRMARWILTFLPIGLGLFISLLSPHYLSPLLSTSGGQIVIAFAAAMVVTGSLVIKKIVEIKV